jgi:hypothetical protein
VHLAALIRAVKCTCRWQRLQKLPNACRAQDSELPCASVHMTASCHVHELPCAYQSWDPNKIWARNPARKKLGPSGPGPFFCKPGSNPARNLWARPGPGFWVRFFWVCSGIILARKSLNLLISDRSVVVASNNCFNLNFTIILNF